MTPSRPIRIKTIALPTEHGGWGFLFEPIVLGMLVAPSVAGACFSVAAVAAFLSRHPLKLALRHHAEVVHSQRYRIAAWFAGGYLLVAMLAFAGAVLLAGWKPVLPMVVLSPLTLIFLLYDTQDRGRTLIPELAGPLGLAATAPSIAMAAGWSAPGASALWFLQMARTLPSIFYVRARLRLEKGKAFSRGVVGLCHVIFAGVVAWLVWRGLAPMLSLAAFGLLVVRAAVGLSPLRRLTRARQIGFLEIAVGLTYAVIVATGYLVAK